MMHIVLWPFKIIDSWIRRHYEKKQINKLISIEERRFLLETVPDLNVYPRLVRSPAFPRRGDIPIVDVTIRNDGGKTNLTEGHFWISRSDDPAYKDEKHLIEFEMPKGKEENFFFYIKLLAYQQIVKGDSILKFGYELHFYGPNQQTETSKKSYRYAPQKDAFIIE